MKTNADKLIESLQDPALYPHEVSGISVAETHISWVILTGAYAYKIKKPVDLGFLDFSTLEKRKHYCEEEIRLNSRLAADIYIDVITICGSPDMPVINGDGAVIEYAVRMHEFNPDNELDKLLDRNRLKPEHIDRLAEKVAAFHQHIEIASESSPYGSPETVLAPCIENLDQIQSLVTDPAVQYKLESVWQWTNNTWNTLKPIFVQRKSKGYIRECHGDLHLHNIALHNDDILIFDCIEFNPNLYWIDVISEIAFTIMDLDDRNQSVMGWMFLNHYLQLTGDYDGITVLRYYLVYRAMVRAKVDCIRAHQQDIQKPQRDQVMLEFESYLNLANRYIQHKSPTLIIMHGLSGSGKTTIAQDLAMQLGAIHIRSDIERKRLHGMTAQQRSDSSVNHGIYTKTASQKTYQRLAEVAESTLKAGYNIIIDAAFLSAHNRAQYFQLSQKCGTPCTIIDCLAPESVLRSRISRRYRAGSDASEATLQVLEQQLQSASPLDQHEKLNSLAIDTSQPIDIGNIVACLATGSPASC